MTRFLISKRIFSRPDLSILTELLVKATEVTAEAISELQLGFNRESIKEKLKEIHTLENASDQAFRSSLAALFDEPNVDALYVIKWKEMYDTLERTIDSCMGVAQALLPGFHLEGEEASIPGLPADGGYWVRLRHA